MKTLASFNTKTTWSIGLRTKDGDTLDRVGVVAAVAEMLSRYGLDGFKIIDTFGYWKGVPEPSLDVVLLSSGADMPPFRANQCAHWLACEPDQESVLVEQVMSDTHFAALIGA